MCDTQINRSVDECVPDNTATPLSAESHHEIQGFKQELDHDTSNIKPDNYTTNFNSDSSSKSEVQESLIYSPIPGLICDSILKNEAASEEQKAAINDASILLTHQQSSPPYYCDICHREFKRQSNLTEHLFRHAGKEFACTICWKKFSCVRYLSRHFRTHVGSTESVKSDVSKKVAEKSYLCTFCNKNFNCKSHLVAHTRIHTGEKPYSCDVCTKSFNHKSHLTAHLRIHSGEKPFQCRICGKYFRDQSNLTGHMRVHDGQKPFACPECEQQFNQRSQLKKHLLHHNNGDDPSKDTKRVKVKSNFSICTLCNFQFVSKRGHTLVCDNCKQNISSRGLAKLTTKLNAFVSL